MAARDPGGEKHAVFFCVSLDRLNKRGTAHNLMERDSTVLPTESYARNATSLTTSALYANPESIQKQEKQRLQARTKTIRDLDQSVT